TFNRRPNELLITSCAKFVVTGSFYIFTTFIVGYGASQLNVSFEFMMISIVIAAFLTTMMIPVMGRLSDRVGGRRVFLVGTAGMLEHAFPYLLIVNTHPPAHVITATLIGLTHI